MERQKKNSSLWYSSGLVLLLCIAIPVLITGTAFARYSADIKGHMAFVAREAEKIQLGTSENNTFVADTEPSWVISGEEASLTLAVANGSSEEDYSKNKQRISLSFISGAGLSFGTETPELILVLPSAEEGGEDILINATAKTIEKGTALYETYGEGWVLDFLDENGKEVFWELEGGKFNFVTINVKVNAAKITESVLLFPKITAEIVDE
ncbi:MAG: hypothetical protein IKJ57_01920 [Oscillospiraceae bacterium]|nr:hypothetical protein [Oscillospiraceae bacterium]